MPPKLSKCLEDVLRLSDEMVELAGLGNQVARDVDCGVLFGSLLDCGYKLRKMAEAELRKNAGREESSGPARRTVLIVDDEPDTRTYLSTWFRDHGFEPATAEDGAEAMRGFDSGHPDLITLDMNMPEKSGVKVLRHLKSDPALKRIPVIVITGIGEPLHQFFKGLNKAPKPDGFLSKPIDLKELEELVARLMA